MRVKVQIRADIVDIRTIAQPFGYVLHYKDGFIVVFVGEKKAMKALQISMKSIIRDFPFVSLISPQLHPENRKYTEKLGLKGPAYSLPVKIGFGESRKKDNSLYTKFISHMGKQYDLHDLTDL